MAQKKTGGLGRGLGELFGQNQIDDNQNPLTLKISDIEPNREQPRNEFDEVSLAELADSITKHGLLQPLIVRPMLGGSYQIVAGERRWRACRMAGLSEVPVIIKEIGDSEAMEIALIENLQREDLTPVEEALGYKSLIDNYGFTQEEVSKTVGKSRPAVANALRLLNLPEDILNKVNTGDISAAQGRTLLSFKKESDMKKAADMAVNQQLTVRDLEKMAKRSNDNMITIEKDDDNIKAMEAALKQLEITAEEYLGRRVRIKANENCVGTIEFQFYSHDDLQNFLKSFEKDIYI